MSGREAQRQQAARVAALNDHARRAMGVACMAMTTPGFRSLSTVEQSRVCELVETFDAFTSGNDPYGERDFGAVYRDGDGRWSTMKPEQGVTETLFWKIEYYDRTLEAGSTDPADPAVTQRVLTLMLASEY